MRADVSGGKIADMDSGRASKRALLAGIVLLVIAVLGIAVWQGSHWIKGGKFNTPEAETAHVGSDLPPGEGMPYGSMIKADLPPVPSLKPGCEGECCGILQTPTTKKQTVLYEKPEKDSKVVATLAEGEGFREARSFIKVLRYGKAVVREDVSRESEATSDLRVDDELTLISYEGEGYYLVWAKGYTRALAVDPPAYELQSEGETESWVEITTQNGIKGWALAPELDWGWC